ncbi:hypothetical protein ACYK62_002348 [Enterococcus faecium]|uniref:hypothetical protein n=1 Tax=Enterococcus faecium TaxID=1352 RepID=UPI000330065B|nr:hypothetical protein [Enterococcus faecium]EMF0319216.1 hypothetical protein [Enterococcus faecium]EOF50980.1 hypothetical protein SCW_02571 [Enterococcus faecium EnGen0131]ERT32152.1 hypothetical protein O992_02121 [Enterococcus faecium NEF1]MDW3721263.1 hypothetical protein [Enterococcus faecium]WOV49096.1 hypothetical protein R5U33_12385 [Enterococcus faecium]
MTDGASQGLFVIVAVVIFGIFVLIAYILFREILQDSLTGIFENATDTAEASLNYVKP